MNQRQAKKLAAIMLLDVIRGQENWQILGDRAVIVAAGVTGKGDVERVEKAIAQLVDSVKRAAGEPTDKETERQKKLLIERYGTDQPTPEQLHAWWTHASANYPRGGKAEINYTPPVISG